MKRALIVGPTYPPPYQLAATPNNIANWINTLNQRGFSNRVVLQGNLPVQQIRNAIEAIIASTGPIDQSAIILLGHGGRLVDTSGDELDGYDECFAASDLQPICDDWLKSRLALLPTGARMDFVSDICYAGTSTDIVRAASGKECAPEIDSPIQRLANVPFRGPRKATKATARAIIPGAANHRLWAACGPSEFAYTCLSGGLWHSLFSLYLCWALRAYPTKTAIDLMNLVSGYVTLAAPGQHPQLEGSNLTAIPF